MNYWLYFRSNSTGTWLPINLRFRTKDEGRRYIKWIKQGDTIYDQNHNYKVGL